MHKRLKQNIVYHIFALVLFYGITVVVFHPYFMEGKYLVQHDIQSGKGMMKYMQDHAKTMDEEVLWNNGQFSGMPDYLLGVSYLNPIFLIKSILSLRIPYRVASICLFGFVGFYILMLTFRVHPILAFIASLTFGLSTYNLIGLVAGHNMRIETIATMAYLLAGINLCYRKKYWIGVPLTIFASSTGINAGHYQMIYYFVFLFLALGISKFYYAYKEKNIRPFVANSLWIFLAVLLGFVASNTKFLMTMEYTPYSMRGESILSNTEAERSEGLDNSYIFQYSQGVLEPMTFVIPNFYGGANVEELSGSSALAKALKRQGVDKFQIKQYLKSAPTYWGDMPVTVPYYFGITVMVLFVVGLFFLSNRQKLWLLIPGILGILLSWGDNFMLLNGFVVEYFPYYNKFRSVSFTLIIAIFSFNILGFIALDKLLKEKIIINHTSKVIKIFGYCLGFLFLLLLASNFMSYGGSVDSNFPAWFTDAIRQDRKSMFMKDVLRGIFFVGLLGGIFWMYAKQKISTKGLYILTAFIIFLDVYLVSGRILSEDNFISSRTFNTPYQATKADKIMMNDTGEGERVLNLRNPFNESRTSFFHESVGGYHPVKLRRYQDLIEHCIQQEMKKAVDSLKKGTLNFSRLSVLNMLNTKYLYAGEDKNAVFLNGHRNGNAWVVKQLLKVKTPDEEMDYLKKFDSKTQAVLNTNEYPVGKVSGEGTVQLLKRNPHELEYKTNISGGNALVVFSEIFYPVSWVATIDDEETPILRVNYALRGLVIPSGDHTIKFRFDNSKFEFLLSVMQSTAYFVILLLIVGCVVQLKKDSKDFLKNSEQ